MSVLKKWIKNFRVLPVWKKIMICLGSSILIPIFLVLFLFLGVKFGLITEMPSNKQLKEIDNPLSTNIYAADGTRFGQFFDENRGNMDFDEITPAFKKALLATEDVRFYKHRGIDYRALSRVFVKTILMQRRGSGGGSTLTQQLVKNLYPRESFPVMSTVLNKFREMNLAQRIESVYSKDEIMLLYLNTVSFGERAFGLYTAAERFFGKEPKKLNTLEAATLVGMLKAPTYYSPRRYPERCKKRRNVVLKQMEKYGYLTMEAYQEYKTAPLKVEYQSLSKSIGLARYFQVFVRKEFEQWAKHNRKPNGDAYEIKRDGLKIYTTLDYDMQIAAELQMKKHMAKLQGIFDRSWKGGQKFGRRDKHLRQALRSQPAYKALRKKGMKEAAIIKALSKKETKKVWTWKGVQKKTMSPLDSLKHYMSLLHTGTLAAQAKTGAIRAYVGGIDFSNFQFDNVCSKRQVGSTFKPIVYLTAMEQGVTSCSYFPNELRTYTEYKDWTPQNSSGKYGGYLTVREAMTHSVNTVSVQMIFKAGIGNVIKKARNMGIQSSLPELPSIVLGTADISLFEMVQAYANLATGGNDKPLHAIRRIENMHGEVLYEREESKTSNQEELPAPYADLHHIMSNVTEEGTAARLYNYDIPFPVMGKTGTTQRQTDGWFIGFTQDLVIGSWVGVQHRGMHFRNLRTGSGGRTALPMVAGLFEYTASQGYRPSAVYQDSFPACPDSIGQAEYAYLQEHPGDYDFKEDPEDPFTEIITAILKGGRSKDEARRKSYPNRRTKAKRSNNRRKLERKRKRKKRMSEFEAFRREVERELRDLFTPKRKKKRKKKRRRNR